MCNHHSRSVIEKQSRFCILYLLYWYASLYFSVVQLKPTRGKSLLLVVAWIDTSGPNTGSIITPRYNVCSHLLHITVLQWLIQHMAGLPHTHEPKTHTLSHTHIHQDVRGSSHHVWLSVICRWVLDFPSSAVVSCQNRKLPLYGGIFLMAPARDGNTEILWFPLTTCACRRKCLAERDIQRSGIRTTPRTSL